MLQIEIAVAPRLVVGIDVLPEWCECLLANGMKVNAVFLEAVIRCQIHAAAEPPDRFGIVAGGARTSQLWKPQTPHSDRTGIVLGLFVDQPTPKAGLSVRVEGAWIRRAGGAEVDGGGGPVPGLLRSDYLSLAVHLRLGRSIGPVEAYAAFGPTIDHVFGRSLDPILSQVFTEEKPRVLSATAGGGRSIMRDWF